MAAKKKPKAPKKVTLVLPGDSPEMKALFDKRVNEIIAAIEKQIGGKIPNGR